MRDRLMVRLLTTTFLLAALVLALGAPVKWD